MLMQDIRKANYQIYRGIDDPRKRATLENAVKYIDILAGQASINISSWPVLEIFHNPTTEHIHTDKVKLNKAFFQWLKENPRSVSTSRITAKRKMALVALHDSFKHRRTERLKVTHQQRVIEAQRYLNSYEIKMGEISLLQRDILSLEGGTPDVFAEALSNVISDGWYQIYDINQEEIILTTAEITLSHINHAHKINFQVPMGSFKVRYSLRYGRVYVLRHENNFGLDQRITGSMYHPHVDSGGNVCFGNIRDAAVEAQASMNIEAVFSMVRAVICQFNDDNPYLQLDQFHEQLKLNAKRQEEIRNEQAKQGPVERAAIQETEEFFHDRDPNDN